MRLLFFNRVAVPLGGGMNRFVMDTAKHLRAAGHEVALVHGRDGGHFEGTGYIYDDLDRRLSPEGRQALRLEAIIEDFAPDIIQLHGVKNTLLDGWLAARKPTVRFVHNHDFYCSGRFLTLHGPMRPCLRTHGRGCQAIHWLRGCGSLNPVANFVRYRAVGQSLAALNSAHALQVMSGSVARQLVANGFPSSRVVKLPPSVPAPHGPPRGAPSSIRTILHVGGLLGHKGMWMVAQMAWELPRDVQIVFAGGGRDKELLEAHIRRRGLGERVRVVGEPTPAQWALLYREAALVVMPVLWNEPLGLDGLAATAYGKPVVAFDTEGIGEWLRDGENGLRVPFGQKRAFRHAVRSLLEDRERLRSLGIRAREMWKKHFCPEHHIAALMAHYQTLLEEAT